MMKNISTVGTVVCSAEPIPKLLQGDRWNIQQAVTLLGFIQRFQKTNVIIRNYGFVETVINLAEKSPSIMCYGDKFDRNKLEKLTFGDKEHYDPRNLTAALSHVESKDRAILLSRINQRRAANYSWEGLNAAIGNCMLHALPPEFHGDFTSNLPDRIVLCSVNGVEEKYSAADLLKPQNSAILAELQVLAHQEHVDLINTDATRAFYLVISNYHNLEASLKSI